MKKPTKQPKAVKPAYTFSADIPKPKTQTLWAVVSKVDGFVYEASATKDVARSRAKEFSDDPEGVTVRRLTVPAFAPKKKKESK
jgi:hypothetical protein